MAQLSLRCQLFGIPHSFFLYKQYQIQQNIVLEKSMVEAPCLNFEPK